MRLPDIDHSRHLAHIDPMTATYRVDVVGCGAVGNEIGMMLACYGFSNVHLHDGKRVTPENLSNQRHYELGDLGAGDNKPAKFKVKALAERMAKKGARPTVHPAHIETPQALGKVVFLAVDKMSARLKIFDECLHLRYTTDYVIEVRVGIDELRVYGLNPRDRAHVLQWRDRTRYNDDATVESACQAKETLVEMAGITASLAMARLRHWHRREIVKDPAYQKLGLPVGTIMMLRPATFIVD